MERAFLNACVTPSSLGAIVTMDRYRFSYRVLILPLAMPILLEPRPNETKPSHLTTSSRAIHLRQSPDLTERHSLYLGRVVAGQPPSSRCISGTRPRPGRQRGRQDLAVPLPAHRATGVGRLQRHRSRSQSRHARIAWRPSSPRPKPSAGSGALRCRLKMFSNQPGRATFAFNPMIQPFWSKFDLLTRTDILCGAPA